MLETILGHAVALFLAVFAVWKLVLEKFLQTKVDDEVERLRSELEKERMEIRHQQELTRERLVTTLSLDAEKSQMVLSAHVAVLEELFVAAAMLQRKGLNYKLLSQPKPADGEEMLDALREFWNLYWTKRLHLTPDLDEKFRDLHTAVMRAKAETDTAHDYKQHIPEYGPMPQWDPAGEANEYDLKAWNKLTDTIPGILDELRAHYFQVMAPLHHEDGELGVRGLVQSLQYKD